MASTTATVIDRVCGVRVEAFSRAAQTEYKGQTYWFCGLECTERFSRNPEQYSDKRGNV